MASTVYSVNQIPIRLTDERWRHIVENHNDLASYYMAAATIVKEIFRALPHLKKIGAKKLWFDFDEEADVLYISLERPQNATDTDMLEDGILVRLRGKKVVGITITNYSHKFCD